jgi:hypothetical protein
VGGWAEGKGGGYRYQRPGRAGGRVRMRRRPSAGPLQRAPSTPCDAQRERRNVQCATCNVHHATTACRMQHLKMQLGACHKRHAALAAAGDAARRAAFNMKHHTAGNDAKHIWHSQWQQTPKEFAAAGRAQRPSAGQRAQKAGGASERSSMQR